MSVMTINLESGMPTVAIAKSRMTQGIRSACAQHITVLKLIHGYGSSGRGGAIGVEVRKQLNAMKRSGKIKEFVAGEDFSPFDANTRKMLDACPELTKDRDYSRCNHGITMILL